MYPPMQRRNRTDSHGSGTESQEERDRSGFHQHYEEQIRRHQQAYFDRNMYEYEKPEDYRRYASSNSNTGRRNLHVCRNY